MKQLIIFLQLMIIIGFPGNAYAGTINVPGDQPTIQTAINVAVAGDTVEVDPGTYNEDINLKSGVIVQGSGADVTTIQGSGLRSVVMAYGVGGNAKLDGFTITGGVAYFGGGIYCHGSTLTISNNVFTGNAAIGYLLGSQGIGGAIYCRESSAAVYNNTIVDNTGNFGGGIGVWLCNSSLKVFNNTIFRNSAEYGGGVYFFGSSPKVFNNTIVENTGVYGVGIFAYWSTSLIVNNCILWNNGEDLYGWGATVTYCCIEDGYAGVGNISADPLFVDAANGDYRLQEKSPCIDAGTNLAYLPATDFAGNPRVVDGDMDGTAVVDMGAYELPVILVTIDIFPDNELNPVNLKSRGMIPVALLSTDAFDAWAVDVDSITFGPDGASPFHIASDDVDGDGNMDMVLLFRQQKTGIGSGDTTATLKGKTTDNVPFRGEDTITVITPHTE